MQNTIGKFILAFLLLGCMQIEAAMTLRAVNDRSEVLEKVQVGRPFTIEVEIKEAIDSKAAPDVKGLDQFEIAGRSWRYQMFNGETTATVQYQVVAHTPGAFTIGPATINVQGTQHVSNDIDLQVGTEQEVAHQEQTEAEPFLRLDVDKNQVTKGERITANLRYYYVDPLQTLRNFIEHPAKDLVRKKSGEPTKGTQTIDGTEYNYIEIVIDVYPETTGALTLPAYAAEYEKKVEQNNIFSFFAGFAEPKRVYSNAVSIQVEELPASDKPIQGVGIFDSFTIQAQPSVAKQGDGIEVSIQLTGDFNPNAVQFAGLKETPEQLRAYESKVSAHTPRSAQNVVVKTFEYVVQGLQAGSYQIPAQEFHYFDTASKQLKTLKTAPLSLTILPGEPTAIMSEPSDDDDSAVVRSLVNDELVAARSVSIAWWLFILFALAPVIVWVIRFIGTIYKNRNKRLDPERRFQNAFATAHAHLATIKASNTPERMYPLFMRVCADRLRIPVASITSEMITHHLEVNGMPLHEIEKWNQFLTAISEVAYGAHWSDEKVKTSYSQASEWLTILKQYL